MTATLVKRTWRPTAVLVLAVSALTACSFGAPPPDQAGQPPKLPSPTALPSSGGDDSGQAAVDVVAKGLEVPWGLAFLPDGTALVTERDSGRILKIGSTDGASASPGAEPSTTPSQPEAVNPSQGSPAQGTGGMTVTPVQTLTGIATGDDGGLLGIAVSPKYKTDQTVYVYYSTADDNRIASLKLGGTPTPLVTGIPHGTSDNGGGLGFGPDGMLYATTGDAGDPTAATNPQSLAGKVLRMKPDGKPAAGNPTASSLVYASGLHDPQGLTWDSGKHLYVTDLGRSSWDEVDLVQPGKNYGWPAVEGIAENTKYADPMVQLKPSEAGCTGLADSGQLLVTSCLTGARLYLIQLTNAGGSLGAPQSLLEDTYGRLRSAVTAPDGSIWVTTSNKDGQGTPTPDDDRILRIVLAGSGVGLS
ncbi:PQQ-dependent sugar dehydrogenase [Rugosimonospora africana]|uniref:PQQ-dependent sugar dehydrogenase n=1 Tax=Rugosimonospora africana TaxID=556532 RepID=UPI001EF390E8|nr:PQQ-dependent sugar dehydrogenase [Rugosimonospora africana]